MKINRTSSNYNCHSGNPAFKQISITANGQKAIDRIPFYKYAIGKDLPIANRQHPTTKYWDLVIDGVKEYDEDWKEFFYNPVFTYINKKTGKTFKNLHIMPPTSIPSESNYVCFSKNHKRVSPEVLLLRSNETVTNEADVKELMFDIKDSQEADSIWRQFCDSTCKGIYMYKALENLSNKYDSSLKISVDQFLIKKDMERILREKFGLNL